MSPGLLILKHCLADSDALHTCIEKELERGGVFVPTDSPPELLAQARLHIEVRDPPGLLRARALVIHVVHPGEPSTTGPGAGLRILDKNELLCSARELLERLRPATKPSPRGGADQTPAMLPIEPEVAAFLRDSEGASHYRVLGISPDVSESDLRNAFFTLAKRFHPDGYFRRMSREAKEALELAYQRVCEAYQVLSSPEKRIRYDIGLGKFMRRK